MILVQAGEKHKFQMPDAFFGDFISLRYLQLVSM